MGREAGDLDEWIGERGDEEPGFEAADCAVLTGGTDGRSGRVLLRSRTITSRPVGTPLATLLALALLGHAVLAAPPAGAAEEKSWVAWFDGLGWPDLRGAEYLEVTGGKGMVGGKEVDGPRWRGFVLAEDERAYTLFHLHEVTATGGLTPRGSFLAVTRLAKPAGDTPEFFRSSFRKLDLETAVAEAIAGIGPEPADPRQARLRLGKKVSYRTAFFLFSRCCAWQGRDDLAAALYEQVIAFGASDRVPLDDLAKSFRVNTEREIAHVLMWHAVLACGSATTPRTELLAMFERIAREFSASEHRSRAAEFVATLQRMVREDEVHARTARPLEEMNREERIRELIFRLRDQNGHQSSQPGSCNIFGEFFGQKDGTSPAHLLVREGHAAVPALLAALDDPRLSRSVGHQRNFYFSHFVLTVGDCAQAILSRIAGRPFWTPRTTSSAMQKDGDTAVVRELATEWWRSLQR